jgi:hypothetical protein
LLGRAEKVTHLDKRIAGLSRGRRGIVTRRQLMSADASKAQIDHRLATRHLHRVHSGVYAVGHSLLSMEGRYMAAVLACGDDALLSHRSAAALWGLRPVPGGRIEVTTPHRGRRSRNGITVHATRSLAPGDTAVCSGIPCTSVARTLLDLAAVLSPRALDRALDQSCVLRLYDQGAVEAVLERGRGRRGARMLRRHVARLADEPAPTRSELERRFLELVRDAGFPEPLVNGLVAGYEVDFSWQAQRLVVETDGRSTHDTPYAFERDRERDLELERTGWHVVRVSWRQLVERPDRVSAMLRRRLGLIP